MKTTLTSTTTVALVLALSLHSVAALSWPTCTDGGSGVWVTQRPSVSPEAPGADLYFFCSGVNLLGDAIEPCINNGTVCDPQAVGDALCQLLGYEKTYVPDINITIARPGEPVRSLTGEYCLRKGVYSTDLPMPADLEAMQGEPCSHFAGITCITSIDTLNTTLSTSIAQLQALSPSEQQQAAPASEETPAALAGESAVPLIQPKDAAVSSSASSGGRKLKL